MDVYIRVSRLGERGEDESTEIYEAQCRDWAHRNGESVDDVVDDTDVSGSVAVAERGLERLIQRVESGDSKGVITPYLDRFGRDLIEGAVALKRINDAGGRLIAVRDGFDSADQGSELMFNLRMSIAQDYLQRVRANWRDVTDRAVTRGIYLSPRVPIGYRKDEERRLTVDEAEAVVIRELFQRRAGGENIMSLMRWMRDRCESEGIRGGQISRSGVRSTLANRIYLGEISVAYGRPNNPRVVRNNHPPILTEEQWEAGQIKHPFSPRNGRAASARLRGLVYCATCGRRCKVGANGPPERRKTNYVCTREGCSARGSILTKKLDGHVEALLMQAAADHEPHVEAVILGDARYQDAMTAVRQARETFEEFRDSIELQRQLGIDGFAKGLRVRREALEVARRELSSIRPTARRASAASSSSAATREAVEAAIAAETNAQFVDRVVLRPTGGTPTPTAERTDVFLAGSDEPYSPAS